MKGCSVLDQRLMFVTSVRSDGLSIAAACLSFGISRPTGYEYLRRYDEHGAQGLIDMSRAPRSNPHCVPDCIKDKIVIHKGKHLTWGPKKIRAALAAAEPEVDWPSVSTFCRILDAKDLVRHARPHSKPPRLGELTQGQGANDVWCIDFKGQFKVGSGALCYPFTATDNESRFLLRCHGLSSVCSDSTWASLASAFCEYGLPLVIRSDNGAPFAATSATGLSRMSVRLIKLGIRPERIDPGSPQQNGRHERMHRTLKAEATEPPAQTIQAQQTRFDAWRREFNEERPHEALGMKPPAAVYSMSERRMPTRIPDFEYSQSMPKHRVRPNGCMRWRGHEIFISEALASETIGVEQIDDAYSAIYAGFLPIAVLDLAASRLLNGKHAMPYLKTLIAATKAQS
jgi:transposase InsO family protein